MVDCSAMQHAETRTTLRDRKIALHMGVARSRSYVSWIRAAPICMTMCVGTLCEGERTAKSRSNTKAATAAASNSKWRCESK